MQSDFLIIGSGISGLNFALNAAKKGSVIIVTKKKIIDSNTNYAQGGIASVLDKTDDFTKHIEDTLEAGCYHNNKKAVRFMVEKAPEALYRLIDLGVEFTKEKGKLKLTQEGGHSHRRIAYVGDYTGKEIEEVLVKRVKEHPNIEIMEDTFALDLLIYKKRCLGASVIKGKSLNKIFALKTVLATGGIGQLYKSTTNANIATGDGIAIGIRAGLKTRDLEFIQFHPTALNKNTFPKFLISETVRGEGGKLVNGKGEDIMKGLHKLGDLAPRDIVAREIYRQEQKGEKVFLDITKKKTAYLKKRFPKIHETLKRYGYDMAKDQIPITPAAHYECGGLITDLQGKTKIKNLFAFGEVTCTGVHGANRLASNSLLEALVFSNQIIDNLEINEAEKEEFKKFEQKFQKKEITNTKLTTSTDKTKEAKAIKREIKKLMWQYAGIVRNRKAIKKDGIPKLKSLINKIAQDLEATTKEEPKSTNQEITEAKNMAEVGLAILQAAHKRRHSLGCHFVENGKFENLL